LLKARDKQRALVNTIMKIQLSQKQKIDLLVLAEHSLCVKAELVRWN
jgi:hypothetical protein